jgi:hypothetical protein
MLQEVETLSTPSTEEGERPTGGFDPDDAALDNVYIVYDDHSDEAKVTPLIYFAEKGDPKMCRYLISRGASTTKSCDHLVPMLGGTRFAHLFPMHVAAENGHLEICKLLYANGAQNDLRRGDGDGLTPFHAAAYSDRDDVLRWLTLHGALCADVNSDNVEVDRIYPAATAFGGHPILQRLKRSMSRSCWRLVGWAKEVTQTHSSLVTFLGGTLPPPPGKTQRRTIQCLSGHPGVRKHIGDFVGLEVTKAKQLLRILRQVVDLPSFIVHKPDDEE